MEGDELTEDELESLLPDNFLDDLKECEPDAEALAKLDELEAFDRFERILADEPARVSTFVSWPPALSAATPVKAEEAATAPSEIGSTICEPDFSERVQLRSTKRKAGRFLPGCFGSQFLHDPESADCAPCRFSKACKKAIADEMPLFVIARRARKAQFKASDDPKQREFLRGIIRGYHLGKYRKALDKRRQKDRDYQNDKRANPSAEILIERELQERLAALRYAVAWPRKDKRLEQLRGNETKIIDVWEAQQHALLAYGAAASDAQVAKTFNEMNGADRLSRHQARSYRRLFRSLEQSPYVWMRFVASSDEKSA